MRALIKRLLGRRRERESSLLSHARMELAAAGLDKLDSDYDGMLADAAIELLTVFSKQGHSGASAAMVTDIFQKLARYQPLCPLTGEDSEWGEVGPGVWQNRRCGRVFKQADRFDGQAYDMDGRVFREPNGVCFTSADSRVPITFPYTPTTEYVDVPFSN